MWCHVISMSSSTYGLTWVLWLQLDQIGQGEWWWGQKKEKQPSYIAFFQGFDFKVQLVWYLRMTLNSCTMAEWRRIGQDWIWYGCQRRGRDGKAKRKLWKGTILRSHNTACWVREWKEKPCCLMLDVMFPSKTTRRKTAETLHLIELEFDWNQIQQGFPPTLFHSTFLNK